MATPEEHTDNSDSNREMLVREALRQTELHLEDLLQTASAAEQRVYQLAATCVMIATVATALANEAPNAIPIYVSAAGLVVSALWAIWGTGPRLFHIRGHRWKDWKGHVEDKDTVLQVLISQAEENDKRIEENLSNLKGLGRHTKGAMVLTLVCLLLMVLYPLLELIFR